MQFTKKKALGTAAIATVVALGAGTAFAYWTSTGSGDGTATAGTTGTVKIFLTPSITGLTVNEAKQDLYGDFTNDGAPVGMNNVVVSIASITNQSAGPNACTAADFAIENKATGVAQNTAPITNGVIPSTTSPAHGGEWKGLTIRMVNKPRSGVAATDAANNQDACKNATVNLSFSLS